MNKLIKLLRDVAEDLQGMLEYADPSEEFYVQIEAQRLVEDAAAQAAKHGAGKLAKLEGRVTPLGGLIFVGVLLAWAKQKHELIGIRDIAEMKCVSERTARRHIAADKAFPLPVDQPGHPRWRRSEVELHLGV